MTLQVDEHHHWVVAPRDFPTNKGGLCRKGWTAAELLNSNDRLTTPLIRGTKGKPLVPASWDDALDFIAEKIKGLQRAAGPDSIGVFGGGGLTNEKAYLLGKFARVALRTKNIDYNGRFCMASSAIAGIRAFGVDRGLPFPMEGIAEADTVLIFGSNPAETLPPIMQYFEEQRARGGTLIVVDPRRTATAKLADLHLQVTPGTDGVLASGLLHIAIRDGLIDHDFIATRTIGYEPAKQAVASYWPDRVERITGVPAKLIERAAHMVGQAGNLITLSGRGPEQQTQGVDNVLTFINLMLALGKCGRPKSGYGCLTGQGNGQGGREHGQKSDQLPGYRQLANATHRAEVAAVWDINPNDLPGPGLSAVEMLNGIGQQDGLRALLVFACNLAVSAPGAIQSRQRLSDLDLLVVADPFMNETAALADVVLPVTQWAEEEGTMTNLEGRVIFRRRAKDQPAGIKTDIEILKALADRLGSGARFSGDARTTFKELRAASAGGTADYAGISYDRIVRDDGIFWPCPDEDHPGTPRMFLDRFGTPDGLARFHVIRHRIAAEDPDGEFPYFLTTGRVLVHYQSGAQTRRIRELNEAEPDAFVEINPDTARGLGIVNTDWVRLTTRRGDIVVKARLTRDIRLDTVFVPFHWGNGGCANILTNDALDPVSKIPEFKVCAVRIERCEAPPANLPSIADMAFSD